MAKLKSAEEAFRGMVRNFMTPKVLGYYEAGLYAAELSEGTGVDGEPIFGVSVMRRDLDRRDKETASLSRFCCTREEAEEYIEQLRQRGKQWWKLMDIRSKA
ncbi:hypothetical protein [Paenibacillus alkalitolerans]|uniref:hypothetical protein n=1 Tax=Paenibacillus alkalitolerans TaxID=2799335 RepID=UPI0018F388C0|nr:hypothetical protein [Paenibacillus alkalitolerans]